MYLPHQKGFFCWPSVGHTPFNQSINQDYLAYSFRLLNRGCPPWSSIRYAYLSPHIPFFVEPCLQVWWRWGRGSQIVVTKTHINWDRTYREKFLTVIEVKRDVENKAADSEQVLKYVSLLSGYDCCENFRLYLVTKDTYYTYGCSVDKQTLGAEGVLPSG